MSDWERKAGLSPGRPVDAPAAYVAPNILSITFGNHLEELKGLAATVQRFCAQQRISSRVAFDMALVLEEVVANVIRHGFEDDGRHEIRVTLEWSDGNLTATVEDEGRPFDPLLVAPFDPARPLAARGGGGMGIHLVRRLSDGVEYRREGNCNVLRVRKATGA